MQFDKEELRKRAEEELKLRLSPFAYSTFMDRFEIEAYDENKLAISVESPTQKDVVVNNYMDQLNEIFKLLTHKIYDIEVLSLDEVDDYKKKYTKQNIEVSTKYPNLNPNYTFETFVVGGNNQIAEAAAHAVAESPSAVYNPLFIYGGPGLGKTHLIQAVANKVIQSNPKAKVVYVSAEKFLIDLVQSIKNRERDTEDFRKKYRNIDIFLMDDVQFLSGKEGAQLELFNTFNHLHENGKQIVISADKPPKDIPVLEERLRSRFNQGVIVDISKPNFETRLAILRKKADEKNIIIESNILALIAEKISSNIRDLEGVLNKVLIISSFTKTPITREVTEKAINEISLENESMITQNSIIEVVSNYFNVSKKDILSSNKSKKFVFPRQIAMYFCRHKLELPYKEIGDIFGKKDHTTIMHAESKIAKGIEEDKNTKLIVESVDNILNSLSN